MAALFATCDAKCAQVIVDREIGHDSVVRSIVFSPDNRLVASAVEEGAISVWNVLDADERVLLLDILPNARTLTFSPDGGLLAATYGLRRQPGVMIWDTSTWEKRYWLPCADMETPAAVNFSPDGKRVAIGSLAHEGGYALGRTTEATELRRFGTIEVWESADFERFTYSRDKVGAAPATDYRTWGPLSKHRDAVASLVFSQNGGSLLTAGWDRRQKRGSIIRWLLPHGTVVSEAAGLDFPVHKLVNSSDGKVLASLEANTRIPGAATKQELSQHEPTKNRSTRIRLWDPEKLTCTGELNGHDGEVTCIALSSDGRYLASGGIDQVIRIWKVESKSLLLSSQTTTGAIVCIAFSPNGRILARGTVTGKLLLWDIDSLQHQK
jgi:WD40 repeat protein